MKFRLFSLAVVPAVMFGPCAPPGCQPPPPASILDLEFLCKYPGGPVDFGVDNRTATTRAYVAYDADSGFRLTDGPGAVDFSIGPNGFDIKQFASEFELERVMIAPPGLEPGEGGFYAYDTETVGSLQCVTDD